MQQFGNLGSHAVAEIEEHQIRFVYEETLAYLPTFTATYPDAVRMGILPIPGRLQRNASQTGAPASNQNKGERKPKGNQSRSTDEQFNQSGNNKAPQAKKSLDVGKFEPKLMFARWNTKHKLWAWPYPTYEKALRDSIADGPIKPMCLWVDKSTGKPWGQMSNQDILTFMGPNTPGLDDRGLVWVYSIRDEKSQEPKLQKYAEGASVADIKLTWVDKDKIIREATSKEIEQYERWLIDYTA